MTGAQLSSRELDAAACYRAVSSRDRRFDGMFVTAVRTTKIYCRPSCPAITPKPRNVDFYLTAAGAQAAGFRACKRCIPDSSPGSPDWDVRGDAVARAMRLIGDGVVDRDGVDAVAARIGYSARHLHRMLMVELGAGPLAIARARRAHTARSLIESTDLTLTEIAFAAGFGSVRQFNDTIRAVYDATPSQLRATSRGARSVTGAITVRLAARAPFAGEWLFDFLAARAIPGVEHATPTTYSRALDLPRGHGIVDVTWAPTASGEAGLEARFTLAHVGDLTPAVERVRRLFDLDADPLAVDQALSGSALLAPLVAATPGLRAAGSVDPWETLVRAVIGQQISVAAARTVAGKIVERLAAPLTIDHPHLTRVFVRPDQLLGTDLDLESSVPRTHFPMPRARARTLLDAAQAVASGEVVLDADRITVREQLRSIRGIGPWTADYVAMRGMGDPDVFLASDLGVRHALAGLRLDPKRVGDGAAWAPWRTYAMHHLWHSLTSASPSVPPPPTKDTR